MKLIEMLVFIILGANVIDLCQIVFLGYNYLSYVDFSIHNFGKMVLMSWVNIYYFSGFSLLNSCLFIIPIYLFL